MATFLKLIKDNPKKAFIEVFERRNSVGNTREKEYKAAVQIQSWYRKIRTQCYLK